MLELAKIQQQNYIGIHHGTTRLVAQYVEADLRLKSGYYTIAGLIDIGPEMVKI